METIIRGKTVIYLVQYSRRQDMELELKQEGHVLVKAPVKAKEYEIQEFLEKNARVLIKHQENLENRQYVSRKKDYEASENFLYMGKACKLEDILNPLPEDSEQIRLELQKWYTRQTKKMVQKRVAFFENIIKVKAKGFTIVDSPASWGTCNSNGELTFNYRLSMAAPAAIDYVVIHELCHLLHLNHDRSFWRDVGKYDKNYKAHQDYLAGFGGVMTI